MAKSNLLAFLSYFVEVTALIHEFSEEFDATLALQKMKSGRNWPRKEYIAPDADFKLIGAMLIGTDFFYQADLVEELKKTPPDLSKICELFVASRAELNTWDEIMAHLVLHDNEIADTWNLKRERAANCGTWMHAMLEHLLNGYQICPGCMEGELNAAIRALEKMGNVEVFRTEWCVHAPEEDLAGSIDVVLKIKGSSEFIVLDWKRSEKLKDKFNSYGKNMKVPLQEVPDCQGHHYRLQLNTYRWILERYYDIKIVKMIVVCVHPNYLPDGFIDEVPDMQESVSQLMDVRRQQLLAKAAETRADVAIPATEPFEVRLSGTAAHDGDHFADEFKAALSILLDNDTDEVPQAAKKRRRMPGADKTSDQFQSMFEKSKHCISSELNLVTPDVKNSSSEIVKSTNASLGQLRQVFPTASEELLRLIMVAAYISEKNIADKIMLSDAAAVFWLVEGGRHVRVHKGFLHIYNDDGSFVTFGGIPPEAALHRISNFFTELEGIYRRMKDDVQRNSQAIATAIVSDSQNFPSEAVFLENCRRAARSKKKVQADARLDADPDEQRACEENETSNDSWTDDLAEKTWKVCCVLKFELMQTRMISLIVEWCETEDQREAAVCYNDSCFVYDRPGSEQHIEAVRKGPANNCYVHIPHNLLDPVLDANMKRLERFYEQTFWCNFKVFQCFQAALALAKRGLNIDRCFIGISPGGVGQSLYSLHLSEMYKQHHMFFDPNVWHMEEELRKQAESLAKCFILTGQEAPESSKKLHIDLFKKTMSGDGIMGRKPYGYTTRMWQIVGWKRLEMNRMMNFAGVSVSNFNSMFRRGFVWKAKARFIHQKFLCNYLDHEKDGIFAADPSLNKFLATSQASVAGLRIQWAFERMHGRDACYQFIEDYCNGEDNYITEDVMRQACGLPVRHRQVQEEKDVGLAAVLEADAESQKARDAKDDEWDNFRQFLFDTMLSSGMELLSYTEFKKLTLRNSGIPNMTKEALWDAVEAQRVLRPGIVKHKTSKVKPGSFLPFMTFAHDFKDILPPVSEDDVRMHFEEQHDIQKLRSYAFSHGSRRRSAEVLEAHHKSACQRLTGSDAKKGRRQADIQDAMREHKSALLKLKAHEDSIKIVLRGDIDTSTGVKASQRKRYTPKELQSEELPSSQDSAFRTLVSKQIKYHYPAEPAYSVKPRRYSGAGSAQAMSRRLQVHVLDAHCVDLDIQNCCLTLVYQILEKIKPTPALPQKLSELLYELAYKREDFFRKINAHHSEGKQLVNTVVNGGRIPDNFKNDENVQSLQKLSLYLRWTACNLLHDDYLNLKDVKSKPFPEATVFSLMWHAVEDRILQCWSEHVLRQDQKPLHVSLHFDGMRVSRNAIVDIPQFCKSCEKEIEEKVLFKVKIVQKIGRDFLSAARENATAVPPRQSLPDICTRAGNCIPCALWHIAPILRETIVSSLKDANSDANKEAAEVGYRSYRSANVLYKADLESSLGLPHDKVQSFMLHAEGKGRPHCVAVQFSSKRDTVMIFDAKEGFRVSAEQFQEAFASAVDRSTIASYWLRQSREADTAHVNELLDMVAGCSSEESDDDGNNLPSLSASRIDFDSEGRPFISDNIMQRLEREVADMLENLDSNCKAVNGKRKCPFCPFRSFTRLKYLRTHVTKYHSLQTQFVASGTKQTKVILALYDNDASLQVQTTALLRRSAEVLGKTIRPPLETTINLVDKHIRLVFDDSGPVYLNASALGKSVHVRRVGNIYYTHKFADMLLREMVMSHAQVCCTHTVVVLVFCI